MKLRYIPAEDVSVARVQVNLIAIHVVVQFLCPQDLGYPHQLVVVVVTVEERLLAKYLQTRQNKKQNICQIIDS